jgi:hypothetical protein
MVILYLNIQVLLFVVHQGMEKLNLLIIFCALFTKLMNENQNDSDEHLSTILFFYRTIFKVGINHIPFQFVYELHPLLPIEYMLPSKPGQIHDPSPIKILTSLLSGLKKF